MTTTRRRTRLALTGAFLALLAARRREHERRRAERMAAAALEALLKAIDANDLETGEHLRRTAAYALILARAADLDERTRHSVERVALFHDIGKLHAALVDIVHDDDPLSRDERERIGTHPERGAEVMEPLRPFYPDLPDGVLSHHERWDGTGYPRGLRGTRIPLTARIVAIADTFDALTHQRRYRSARPFHEALQIIARGRGTQFDPHLVDLFLSRPVLRAVRRVMQGERLARARGVADRRRRRDREPDAPDITFRWRSESRARPALGRRR